MMNDSFDLSLNTHFFRNIYMVRPPVVNKNLQFLLIYDENNALLGGTNMTDIYWNGTICHYNNILDFSQEKVNIMENTENGVCNGVYLGHDKFVTVMDGGIVEFFEIIEMPDKSWKKIQSLHCACEHDDSVLTVSKFPNNRDIVTGGMDCCLKLWDTEDLMTTCSYNCAHTDIITSTAVNPTNNSVFVSCSLDGESLLWDIRQSKPAHCIFKRNDYNLSAVAWNTALDYLIAVGADDGSIALIDIRQTGDIPLHESIECNRGIHKLLFNPNPERKEQLACCSDDTPVKVFDSSREMLSIFENNDHSDFVRGLAWCKDDLFSCSWDGTVIKHILHNDDQ